MPVGPGTRLGTYEIVSLLGAGGMGEVYLAHDPRLERDVAIKILPAGLAADQQRLRRFELEARAAAALSHPNIVSVHDIGHHDGVPFIVMEYVAGETLAVHLQHERFPRARALEIASEIAEALAVAHTKRVVHRDLKPGNVMLTPDGRIKVLDFGLAKSLVSGVPTTSLHGSAPTGMHTQVGQFLGTPGYMSPEQLMCDPVDHRTDIYSLGVTLFELITGQRPFRGADFETIRNEALYAEPSAIAIDPSVPPDVDALISRAMAKNPSDRPQSAAEFRDELQRLTRVAQLEESSATRLTKLARYGGLALAAALIASIGGAVWWWTSHPDRIPAGRPTIAVLPLANLSGDSSKSYLGVGIADTLTTTLSQLSSIDVVSRATQEETGPPTSTDIPTIARDLGATMIVQGSIQEASVGLRVNATLANDKGDILWTGDSEAPLSNIFAVENRLAASLIDALRIPVSAEERRRLARLPTSNPSALDEYWQGVGVLERADNTVLDEAVDHLRRAVSLDPQFSLAHASLGEAYRRKSVAISDAALMAQAIAEVSEALRIDRNQPEIRLRLANIYRSTGRNGAAVEEIRRAMTDQPANDTAHRQLGDLLTSEGRPEEALAELQRAVSLRPSYWRNYSSLGLFFMRTGRAADAVAAFKREIELRPADASPYQQLGSAYQTLGDRANARDNYQKAIAIAPNPGAYANLGMIDYAEGRLEASARAYEQAVRLAPTRALYHRNLGDVYVKLGRPDAARAAYLKAASLAEEALALNPSDATTMSQLGVYEAKLGKRADADRHSASAIAINPASPEIHYRRGVVLAFAGNVHGALEQISEAISKGYPGHLALEDDDLSSLRSLPAFQSLTAPAK